MESEEEGSSPVYSFACTLCTRRFSRKLHLNNHMESHHGIKFVFTEKGRKVKLVRIPEGFKVEEGEKLDPCVEKLVTTIDKDQLHSIIGVEEIEPDEVEKSGGGQNEYEDMDECSNRLSDLLNGKIEGSFGCGFLFRKINYPAYQVTVEKKETAFAVFYPPDQNSVYLLKIVPAGENQHLFLPATKKDVRNALSGASRTDANYSIALVAALRLVCEDPETPIMSMTVEPLPAEKPTKVEIMPLEDFVNYARKCQGSVIKSLADSIDVSPSPAWPPLVVDAAPKQKRKFQRRTTRAILKAESMMTGNENLTDEVEGAAATTPMSTRGPKPKKAMKEAKIQKLRRNLKKEFDEEVDDDDDVLKDADYRPTGIKPPKKRGRGRPPGTKNKPKM